MSLSANADLNGYFVARPVSKGPRWNFRRAMSFALVSSGALWLSLGLALRLLLR